MQDYNEDIVIEQLQNPATVRQAFARVVARYSEPLYWQIRKMVLSHDDANDLLQNTFFVLVISAILQTFVSERLQMINVTWRSRSN